MQNVWLIRATPDKIDRLPEFLAADSIAVGWHRLRDLRGRAALAIRDALEHDYPARTHERPRDVRMLDRFANHVRVGDVVIVPSKGQRGVHLATVIEPCHYVRGNVDAESSHLPHRLGVRWLDGGRLVSPEALPAAARDKWHHEQQTIAQIRVEPSEILRLVQADGRAVGESLDADDAIVGIEGERLLGVRAYRRREAKLRAAKIAATLRDRQRLRCEVPNCGFDFEAIYGEIGRGFIHIHHREPLAGRYMPVATTLDGLMLVCPNCHAMIHKDGECRDPATLIARRV